MSIAFAQVQNARYKHIINEHNYKPPQREVLQPMSSHYRNDHNLNHHHR